MNLNFNPDNDMSAHLPVIQAICENIAPSIVLEIGVKGGLSTSAIMRGMLNSKEVGRYHGCDISEQIRLPEISLRLKSHLHIMSSDNLAKIWELPIEFLFIDGDHNYEQVKRDYLNFSKFVVENGFMLFHDTYPPDESYKRETHCGTAYKILDDLKNDLHFESVTLPYYCGLTICRRVND